MKNNNNSRKKLLRDSTSISPWQQADLSLDNAADIFEETNLYDTLIVGGGITGLTTALLLQQKGRQCVLAEARNIGFGTTGGTSAHLNTFFDATYADVESDFSEDAAKQLAACGKEAFELINTLATDNGMNCDLEYKDGYLYAETNEEVKMLDKIFEASKNAGVAVEHSETNGTHIPFQKAIVFKQQGQFHPLKYIYGLAKAFVEAGGLILENTFITETAYADQVYTAKGGGIKIKAKHLVYATHLPPGINIFDFNCAAYRSYVLAVTLNKESDYPKALSYDSKEPYHYLRTHIIDGQKYLLVGGEDHKTGHDDPDAAFKKLEAYIRLYYEVKEVAFKWSSQYYIPGDGLPFIGKMPMGDETTFVATGYNGNGMIFGTIAGKIISDLIETGQNVYTDLFSTSRVKPIAGFMDFVKENSDVAYRFIADRFGAESVASVKELAPDTGTIIKYKGEKLAVYKTPDGKISALNPVCTHAGCIVNFNHAEKSWDCPCHGGRFDLDGKVLTGPPRIDLEKIHIS